MLHSVHVSEQRQHGQIPQSGQRVNHISQVSQIIYKYFVLRYEIFLLFPSATAGTSPNRLSTAAMRPLGWGAACLTCPAAAAWPWSTGIYRTISNIYSICIIYNIYRHVPGPDTWLGSAPQFHCTYHVVTDTRH